MTPPPASPAWLFLAYQLPSQPSNARVAAWRRLQRVGAVQLHGSLWVLPETAEQREDLEWIVEEVVSAGGQATLFTGLPIEAAARDRIVDAFRQARAVEYEAVRAEAQAALDARSRSRPRARSRTVDDAALAARLRERLAAVVTVDFFAAPGRDPAEEAIAALDRNQEDTMQGTESTGAGGPRLAARDYRDRVWVTRPRPGIDRMSTAWLVRRFIDPRATFRFCDPERRASLEPSAVPFDMYGVELGHQQGGCTFETVARRFAIGDPTVSWLARIVHQLDLKTGEPTPPEAAVIGQMVEGLRRMYADDAELLERGMTMFEALYQSESERRPGNTSTKGGGAVAASAAPTRARGSRAKQSGPRAKQRGSDAKPRSKS